MAVVGFSEERWTRAWPLPGKAMAASFALDAAAAVLLLAGALTPAGWGAALILHLAAAASLAFVPNLAGSRRWLLFMLGLALPVIAAPVVRLAFAGGGGTARELPIAMKGEGDPERGFPDLGAARRLGESLPAAEMLLVADADGRRAMLRRLSRRGDADAVALLRWALTAASVELCVEATLALENMSTTFENRLAECRKAVRSAAPRAADALAAGELIAHGFDVGILEAARVKDVAAEARGHFEHALRLDPSASSDVAVGQARLEMAILRPDRAVDALDRALATPNPARLGELRALREEAVLRSHDLPWEGPSLLRTYRRPIPTFAVRSKSGG